MSTGMEHTKEELQRTVREILRVAWYRRWAFIIPFCVAASIVLAWSHKLPRVYKASTVFQRLNTPAINKVMEKRGPASMEAMRRFMADDMLGEESMTKVVDQMGITKNLPRDQQGHLTLAAKQRRRSLANRYRNMLSYKILYGKDYLDEVQIDATGDDPELIVKLVNTVRDNYIEARRSRWLGMLTDTHDLYNQRIDEHRRQIDEKEQLLRQIEEEHPFINPYRSTTARDLETSDKLQLANEKNRSEQLRDEIIMLEERLAQMPQPRLIQPNLEPSDFEMIDTEASMGAERQKLRSLILNIDNELRILRLEKTEKHPAIQQLLRRRSQFAVDLEKLNQELAGVDMQGQQFFDDPAQVEVLRTARREVEDDLRFKKQALAKAETNISDLEARLAKYQQYKESGSEIWPEYSKLKNEVAGLKEALTVLVGQERDYARLLDINNSDQGIKFNVQGRAQTSRRPVLPKPNSIMMLALGLGLAFGACAVFLREFFDHTYHTANAVSFSLGVPILESIDEILLPKDRRKLLLHRLAAIPVVCLLVGTLTVVGGLAWLSLEDPPTYKKIVARVTTTWEQAGF